MRFVRTLDIIIEFGWALFDGALGVVLPRDLRCPLDGVLVEDLLLSVTGPVFELALTLAATVEAEAEAATATCRWLMWAWRSRCDKYVRRQPLLLYREPPCVHIKTEPRPDCSTRHTFSLQRGHSLNGSRLAHIRQKTCLQGIWKGGIGLVN